MQQIIPQQEKKIYSEERNIYIPLILAVILVVGVIASYFILDHLCKKSSLALQETEKSLEQLNTSKEIDLERDIRGKKQRIEDFSNLIRQHQETSRFFGFLERISHPKIWFASCGVNFEEFRVSLPGSADSFKTLGQQLHIFQKEALIKEVSLSGISIGGEDGVSFVFNLIFDPQALK